jgi:sugar phosphate permease
LQTSVGAVAVATAVRPRPPVPILPAAPPVPTLDRTRKWRLIVLIFLPFAAGYYLSYLFRTINALISAQLTSDLALSPAQLGLVTSAYFLTLAALQVPIGVHGESRAC